MLAGFYSVEIWMEQVLRIEWLSLCRNPSCFLMTSRALLSHSDAPPAPGINHLLTEREWKAISFIGAFPPWNSIAGWLFLRDDVETENKFSFNIFIFFAVTARKTLDSYAITVWTPFSARHGRNDTVMISAPYVLGSGHNLLTWAPHRSETSKAASRLCSRKIPHCGTRPDGWGAHTYPSVQLSLHWLGWVPETASWVVKPNQKADSILIGQKKLVHVPTQFLCSRGDCASNTGSSGQLSPFMRPFRTSSKHLIVFILM